ncbi:MAG TPA: hypothetical protein PKD94_16375 [Ignavibacteria bacterium]|nr:hypothetical protein [Ignavibacteria bacterium]
MKTTITLALLLVSAISFSQSKQYYTSTFTTGIFIPIDKTGERVRTGYNFGVDLEARNKRFAVYLNSRINFTKGNTESELYTYDDYSTKARSYTIIEVNIGPRWYLGKLDELNANIDLGFGLYTGSYSRTLLWGPQAGFGFSYPVSQKLTLALNGRLNILGIDYGQPYMGVHAGVKYIFNK